MTASKRCGIDVQFQFDNGFDHTSQLLGRVAYLQPELQSSSTCLPTSRRFSLAGKASDFDFRFPAWILRTSIGGVESNGDLVPSVDIAFLLLLRHYEYLGSLEKLRLT